MGKELIGQKILKARQAKGLTQSELSEISSISIRTIQRLESGHVIPRVYTLKTLSKYLSVDLLPEFDDSEEMDNNTYIHNLLIKWINEIIYLFNLKTYTMKKIIILSVFFVALAIGLYAITNDSKTKKSYSPQTKDSQHGDLTSDNKNLPCGIYAQVIDGDTTYCGLITENYTDLKEIAPTINYTSDFGYKFSVIKIGVIPKQLKGLSPKEYPQNYKPSKNDTTLLTEIGFAFSVPNYNYTDTCIMPVGPKNNPLIGFYFNKQFPSPIGTGSLAEKYFRDHYDLKEVLNKFKYMHNLKVTLNNKPIDKSDFKKLADYEIVKFDDVRSVVVYKEKDDCEIIIKTE